MTSISLLGCGDQLRLFLVWFFLPVSSTCHAAVCCSQEQPKSPKFKRLLCLLKHFCSPFSSGMTLDPQHILSRFPFSRLLTGTVLQDSFHKVAASASCFLLLSLSFSLARTFYLISVCSVFLAGVGKTAETVWNLLKVSSISTNWISTLSHVS